MKDKKIEEMLQKFRDMLEFKSIDMQDMLGRETVFITNDSEDLTDWLRQTMLEYREEIIKDYEKELEKLREKAWKYDELKKIAENY